MSADRLRATGGLLLVPALAIFAALVVGGLVMILSNPETLRAWASFGRNPARALSVSGDLVWTAYSALFRSSLGSVRALSETIVASTPLLFAGLAVAFAFRAGLFNIGAQGQLLIGAIMAAYIGFTFGDLPPLLHLPFALIGGAVAGAAWGFIPGFLKARTGAHEVITTIMLNFVALRLADFFLRSETFRRPGREDPISRPVAESARLPALFGEGYRVHLGIVLGIAAAALIWWLLFRSTLGFRLRTVGANPSAAAYAGMGVGGTYVVAMMIAGSLAGLGGTVQLLGLQPSLFPGFASTYGFDAIALALLGRTHPAGVVAAAFLFGVLRAGSTGMQAATAIPVDIIVVIQALVIAFVAAPALVRQIFRIRAKRVTEAETFTKSWAT